MNLHRNGLIFATFLGSCLCIALLAAAMGTRYWVVSTAAIPHRNESEGKIFYGLFSGEKNLNYGIGLRTYQISEEMSGLLAYPYWLLTVCCIVGGLVFCAVSAVLAVINSASTPVHTITGVPGLCLSNAISLLFQIGVVSLWGALYQQKLKHSVIHSADSWSTDGRAFFGLSYWLVLVSIVVQIVNIVFIYTATSDSRKRKKAAKPVIEEKTNGAIMLY